MPESRIMHKKETMNYNPGIDLSPNTKMALSFTMWIVLLMVSVRMLWKIPVPLFVFINLMFLAVSFVYWTFNHNCENIGFKQVIQIMFLWAITTSSILTLVYNVDRGGWNWFKLTGYNLTIAENFNEMVELSPDEIVNHYGMFTYDPREPSILRLKKGDYEITRTIVLPKNLRVYIEPGAILRFGVGCSLISYSPIDARGTATEPIVFTAKSKWLKWGAVGIVQTEKSIFEYVLFEHGRQAEVNGHQFLAGLSVIESDIEISNCHFRHMYGKDAVNVQKGQVSIKNNHFQNTFRDGLDVDGGAGEIHDNEFIDCGDEGLDLSQNDQLSVFNNKILDERGGRIGAEVNLDEIKLTNITGYLN
ncbi:MAG: right-handed parallel beta-helix repeat-containing protein [bacterium]